MVNWFVLSVALLSGIEPFFYFSSNFDQPLLDAHLQTLKELIQRDKNRPAVIMWSIGNEPQSQKQVSANYFK